VGPSEQYLLLHALSLPFKHFDKLGDDLVTRYSA
jgi:hypothetical protein